MKINMEGWYRINGKIYWPMVVNDDFPQLRWCEVGETINHRVFPNLENLDVQEVSDLEAYAYYVRN